MEHFKSSISFLFLLVSLFLISFTSAESIGEFQLDIDDVEIYQTCNNCTGCNFTRVMGPNNQSILSNIEANVDGDYYYFNIQKENFTVNGEHRYGYSCGNAVEKETGFNTFTITYSGGDLTQEMAMVYGISLAVLLFIFILTLFFISKLPNKNSMDDSGVILQISMLKHLRTVMWGVAWTIILAMTFITSNMSLAYLPNAMVGNLFFAIYQVMFWMTIVMIPLMFIWIFTGIFRDKEFKRMIERGVELRGSP